MFPPKKILFPVDFSERCDSAARMVETFAGHFQADLTLLRVVEQTSYEDIPVDATTIEQQRLGEYLVDELKHFDVKRVLTEGEPAATIIDYAHEQQTDLIMMPTHGYGGFRRLILGSVTAKVLHAAECPVWTGVHMETVPRLEDIAFRRVLCAIDLGAQSCPTAAWAKNFAAEFGAELSIVHAVPEANPSPAVYAHDTRRDDLIHQATERVRKVQECVGAGNARVFVVGDEVAGAVCECAARERSDLLVIGRSVAGGVLGRLRENAYSIIRQSPCPVISI
jgi:nucleotide-binding universal stress UspA family protein